MIIGITGQSGAGKSRAADYLMREYEVDCIHLDEIGHQLLKDPAIIEDLAQEFGADILDEHGDISRELLGQIVFSDSEACERLNRRVHPALKEAVVQQLSARSSGITVIEGALLKELGLLRYCDHVLVIESSSEDVNERSRQIRGIQASAASFREQGTTIKNSMDGEFEGQLKRWMEGVLT